MGKRTTLAEKKEEARQKQKLARNGGLIRVSFCFDDREFVQSHRLTHSELTEQKKLLREHGPGAFDTATLRMSIWGAGKLGEHTVTEAFKEYARNHWKPDQPAEGQVEDAKVVANQQQAALSILGGSDEAAE